jgi:general secretion pathway protein A
MYKDFYGFLTYPFAPTIDPRFLYPSDTYKDCLFGLLQGLQRGAGLLVMTGATGTGKTFLLHTLLQHVDEHTHVAFIVNSTCTAWELLQYAAHKLRLDIPGHSKAQFLIQLRAFLSTQATINEKVVLIVDEAQHLSVEVLEDLRLLTNFESAEKKLIQIMLVGQLPLEETLKCPELTQLRQRVGRIYRLLPLNDDETKAYIERRLAVAGASESIFTSTAIEEVCLYSQGIPRVIDMICDCALVFGFSDNMRQIGPRTIQAVVQDLLVYTPEQLRRRPMHPQRDATVRHTNDFKCPIYWILLAALAVGSLLGAGLLWHSSLVRHQRQEATPRAAPSPAVVPTSPAYREPPLLPQEPAVQEPPASRR